MHVPRRRRRNERLVEVVERRRGHDSLRKHADATDQLRAPVGVELAEDVVEEEERRLARSSVRQQVELGELERKDGRALLAARGERRHVASAELEGDVVPVWPDQGGPVP